MKFAAVLAGAGVLAVSSLIGGAASAATVFDLGVLTAANPLSKSVSAAKGAVDDEFEFKILAPMALKTYAQFIDALTRNSGLFTSGSIALYAKPGTLIPGTLSPITISPVVDTAATATVLLNPGDYFVKVTGTVADPRGANFTIGVFGAAVPEPASWALMITGLGLAGWSLRNARRQSATLA